MEQKQFEFAVINYFKESRQTKNIDIWVAHELTEQLLNTD